MSTLTDPAYVSAKSSDVAMHEIKMMQRRSITSVYTRRRTVLVTPNEMQNAFRCTVLTW